MADAQLNVVLQAQDEASAEIKKADGALGGMAGTLTNLKDIAKGFILADVAIDATKQVKDFVTSAVSDYGALQAAQAQINAVIQSTGNYYHLTGQQVDEYGESLQNTTVYSKTQTDQALALLLSFKNLSGQSIPDLLSVSAALATRMGTDLPTATQQLGRALQDPANGTRLLRSAGIDLTSSLQKQLKAMEDSGNITGAQNIILDTLKQKVGGAAEAYGNTLPGEIAKGKRSLDDFKIAAAGKVDTWIDKIDWPKIMSDAQEMWKAVQPIVQAFEGYLQELATVFEKNLLPDLEALWKALNPALTDALKIVAAIIGASLIVALDEAKISLEAIGDAMNWVKDIIVAGANIVKGAWNDAGKLFAAIPGELKTAWNGLEDIIVAPFKLAFDGIAKMWNETIGKLSFTVPSWVPGIGGKGFSVPQIPLLATGTDNFAGGLAIVGEQGPELVSLPTGAQVTPSQATQQLLQNANTQPSQTVNISVSMGMYAGMPSEKRQIAVDLYTELIREARAHGVQLPQIGSASVQ